MLRSDVIGAYAAWHTPAAMEDSSFGCHDTPHLAKIRLFCYVLFLFP